MNINQYKTKGNMQIFTDCFQNVESVSIVIVVKAGGLYEAKAEFGISHFYEHMAFKGTNTMSYRDIALQFDREGGNFNAYTTKDRTVFYAKVLKQSLYKALDILADIIVNSNLPQNEIEKERQVILQEIAQSTDSAENYIFDLFYESAYPAQALGHDLLGTKDFVESVTRDQLIAYKDKFYTQDNTVIAISGNFDSDKAIKYVEQKFSQMQISHPQKDSRCLANSSYEGIRRHKVQQIDQTHFILGFEGVSYYSPLFYCQNIASMILGESMSSRLFEKLREQMGLCYHISSFTGSYHDTGIFGIYSATSQKNVGKMVEAAKDELAKIASSVSADELQIAKNQVFAGILMSLESTAQRAEKIASNHITFGRFVPLEEVKDRVNQVTANDICEYFAKIILHSKQTFASIGSESKI